MLLTACTPDDEYSKSVTQFTQASGALTQAFQAFVSNANLVEESHYIDDQAFSGKPLFPDDIQAKDVLTPKEIALRTAAIKALTDYMTALGSLAAGKPAEKIEADAKKAGASISGLSSNAAEAFAESAKARKPGFAGPLSSAVTAIGDVLELIEKHRGIEEVRASLKKNDPAISQLFTLLSNESTEFYARRQSTLGETGVILFRDYNTASAKSPANPAELMELTDRIKQYRKDSAALAASNPAKAIDTFKKAHDALVSAIESPKQDKKQSISNVIASIKQFSTEVQPLAQDLGSLAGSF